MKTQLNRRHILRGVGALIALPALESIGFRRFASAAETSPAKPSKRCVFLSIGFGVTKETWFPDINQTGSDYELSEGLSHKGTKTQKKRYPRHPSWLCDLVRVLRKQLT